MQRIAILMFILFSTLGAQSAESMNSSNSEKLVTVRDHPGFNNLVSTLKAFTQSSKDAVEVHHFFIADYGKSAEQTYMFWREGRKLWILDMRGSAPDHWKWVVFHPRGGSCLNIDTDVLADGVSSEGSTFLVHRTWINQVIYDCVVDGELIVINKGQTG